MDFESGSVVLDSKGEKRAIGGLQIAIHGQTLHLLPERCAYWQEARTLLVADCHFGKAASFRHHGLAVPEGGIDDDLQRLTAVIERTQAAHLLVVGDFFHAPTGYRPEIMSALAEWRTRHRLLRLTLVPGNHDRSLSRIPAEWAFEIAERRHGDGDPFVFIHDPADAVVKKPSPRCHVAGHWHPAVALGTGRTRRLTAPCFWHRPGLLVLPSFGTFTGSAVIGPESGDSVYAVSGGKVLEVPEALW